MLAKLLQDSLIRVHQEPIYASDVACQTFSSTVESLYDGPRGTCYQAQYMQQLLIMGNS